MPLLVGKPHGTPFPVADDADESKTPVHEGDPPRRGREEGDDSPRWHTAQDAWIKQLAERLRPSRVPKLPPPSDPNRTVCWERSKELYYSWRLKRLLTGAGDTEYARGTRIEGFHPLHDQLLVSDGASGPVAMEGDVEYDDGGSRGYFARRPPEQHLPIFHDLGEAGGDGGHEDRQLAIAAGKLTPAAVLQRLFADAKRVQRANELIIPRNDKPDDVSAGGELAVGAEGSVNEGLEVPQPLAASSVREVRRNLPDDKLELLAEQFADSIQELVE